MNLYVAEIDSGELCAMISRSDLKSFEIRLNML